MNISVRQIYEDMPPVFTVPAALQHKRVEVILLSLDEMETKETTKTNVGLDENGWPLGFFEMTAGCLADDPIERAPQ